MARTNPPPPLSIKTLFTPSALVCLLALSACTPTSALPISTPHSSTTASSIPSQAKDTTTTATTTNNNNNARSIETTDSSIPFRTVSRSITIQVDLSSSSSSSGDSSSSTAYERLIRHTEQQERFLRDREVEAMARLEREQDELEKAEQDRDQQLDNEEEEQLAQDPETVRRRQEESLGLWMTEAELDAASGTSSASASVRVAVFGRDDAATASSSIQEEETASVVAESKGAKFDLYADDFKEVEASSVEAPVAVVVVPGRIQQLRRLAPEQFTEEEMLQWPIVNQAQFEDRQDEVQDEYEDEQAYPSS